MAKVKPQAKAVASGAKTLSDFRETHDKSFVIPKKIKEGLASLGPAGWEYELDFIRRTGVNTQDFARFREQFEEYFVVVNDGRNTKRVWAGSKSLADKMREMV